MSDNRYTIKIACASLRRFLRNHAIPLNAVTFSRRRVDDATVILARLSDGRAAGVPVVF